MPFSRVRFVSALLASAAFAWPSLAQTATSATPDLSKQPTLYAVGYAHLDTEWRWEYPQSIDEYLYRTMHDNFTLFEKYPHYIFNFSGANRYRLMQEYYPKDFERLKGYVSQGRWFPAGSSMEEGDVNIPSAEALFRQVLYGNQWFDRNLGKHSEEYMLPDCFGFPSSLPSILAHSGVKGFSTQKLVWGSSANAGGPESLEKTPEGTPFNVGVWVGPDGSHVLTGWNPGAYSGSITTDLSTPLPALPANPALAGVKQRIAAVQAQMQAVPQGQQPPAALIEEFVALHSEQDAIQHEMNRQAEQRFQGDWAARVLNNGKVTGLFADYHYYGTGDIGGAPREESVKRLEAIITKGSVDLPPANGVGMGRSRGDGSAVPVGNGPVRVISATADQMFKDITPAEEARLPRYTGELELTNHSAGSLTSQAYQKRWIRKEELLAEAAESSSLIASWLGGRTYPIERLNNAWTMATAAHFHDLAAGTATPRAYEFAWNDDVIGMNQFADVLKSATAAVSQVLDTQTKGIPVVVYNQLNIPREDLVEAKVRFGGKVPTAIRVTAPDGSTVPAQLSNGKIIFLAKAPSVGYAVYDVEPAPAAADTSLHVSESGLENEFYRVQLNDAGDVASIFDKKLNRELLAAPARLALSYDNPQLWPAWNMDWSQEQAAPREYVSGPAKVRVVENGPARVALEVTRETAGSRFVQTIALAAGDAGRRVEFGNAIDWATRERNLKATFPLAANNEMATYNWDVGAIQRPTAQPKKFEVPTHQWIDLTDASGRFGATILTDAKYASDKPDDHTIRLTLIRTPGVAGGYADQSTQDIGHHEFTYGFTGHADGWKDAQTDWQAQRLNAPLLAFAAEKHAGSLGKSFSLVQVSNPRIRILGMKRSENSDEVVVRLVELDGKPQNDVRIRFAAPVSAAREINAQEKPIGEASVSEGALITSFGAFQPRSFALKLAAAPTAVAPEVSQPVMLNYDTATATEDGTVSKTGFDGKGNALPAEMLPESIDFNGVRFKLTTAKTGVPNAITARGQKVTLPEGHFNRVYLLAAAAGGDQKASFEVDGHRTLLSIEDWGGFIGQWDDRLWSSADTAHGGYGSMVGLKPGFIKRADLAWYASHHHDAAGKNVAYSYSYLFAYPIELPAGAKTLTLPRNPGIHILAISVADQPAEAQPLAPLYDELPSAAAGAPDFSLSTTSSSVELYQGKSANAGVLVLPRGSFGGEVTLKADGLPHGVTASFHTASNGARNVSFSATSEAITGDASIRIVAAGGGITHEQTLDLHVRPIRRNAIAVDLAPVFNVKAIHTKGTKFSNADSADAGGYSFAAETLTGDQVADEVAFRLGTPNAANAVSGRTIDLPAGSFASVRILATAVESDQRSQPFTLQYADGTKTTVQQSLSDWSGSSGFKGEEPGIEVPYRLSGEGSTDGNPFHLYAYELPIEPGKQVKALQLPDNRNVIVFAVTLVPAK